MSAELFAMHVKAMKLPQPTVEYTFAKPRRWRFDFAWPEYRVATEIEGLVAVQHGKRTLAAGRHTSFKGFAEDAIKYATANIYGWHVLRFNQALVQNGTAIDLTEKMLKAQGWEP
jgi:very-short-patch-repair endonuclease